MNPIRRLWMYTLLIGPSVSGCACHSTHEPIEPLGVPGQRQGVCLQPCSRLSENSAHVPTVA